MATAFETYFENLRGKKIALLGLGVSNQPIVKLLLEFGCDVTGCDRTPREKLDESILELERMGCKLRVGPGYLDGLQADIVYRTPGMHPAHPALEQLRSQGAYVTSEMADFFRLCPCPIIAVTGSDGKTTTTTLISEMLKAAGNRVWLGGNIGTPLLPLVRQMKETDYAVVELSSFQLQDMESSPNRAVITNLSPNHLDVHKDMDEYVDAKRNIYLHQNSDGLLILNADNAITAEMWGVGETRFFSRAGKDVRVRLENGIIYRGGEAVLETKDIILPGVHNIENYMTAIAAVEGLVSDDVIRRVAATFGGVAHRIELVRIKDGVRYYNDSIASSPSRTIAGLRSFTEKVMLIAGGYDKNIPYDVLGPEICRHVKKLYLGGATGPKIRAAVEDCPEYDPSLLQIEDCGDFDGAVYAAVRDAKEGDIVLMSPASASFDQFKNFEVRGDHFKKLIKEL
jgi:UDP-N-acetylmuramoylalanine--D-glutamate ligase